MNSTPRTQQHGGAPEGDAAASHQLLELVHASWVAQAVYVAAELELADHLSDGPRTSDELARATQTDPPSLHRLLRALVTIDVCRERDDGRFELAPLGMPLRTDAPGSMRHWAMWWGGNLWPVWGNLLYSVRTGKSARSMLLGTDGFGHLERDPAAAAVFNKGLAELTTLAAQSVVAAYDFAGLSRIVDVGGGYGQLLAAILRANTAARGVLFDLPHAVDGARQFLAGAGVGDRCEFVAGDFFQSVPGGADAYVLKSVIHDWNAERGRAILETCRRAMAGNDKSRLLLVERLVPARLEPSAEHQSLARTDLSMLVALAAQERTEDDFRQLLDAAGFYVTRIVPAGMTVSVIEAFARPG